MAKRSNPAAATVKKRTSRIVMDQVRDSTAGPVNGADSVGFKDIADAANGLNHLLVEGVVHF